jgi:hypothetical protein
MEDRSVITSVLAVVLSLFTELFTPLKWMSILGIILIILDLRFGLKKARMRHEEVRFSRAWRRTINKIVDYTCWIMLSAAINQAVAIPLDFPILPTLVMLWIYSIELDSCYSNYCEYKEIKKRSLYRFIYYIIKKRANDTATIICDSDLREEGEHKYLHSPSDDLDEDI